MPSEDTAVLAELTRLAESIALSNKKIDRAISGHNLLEKQLKEMLHAFPDGFQNHREYHEAVIAAKKAEAEFWYDLKKEIIKKGLIGLLVILVGLIWLGIQTWIKYNVGK